MRSSRREPCGASRTHSPVRLRSWSQYPSTRRRRSWRGFCNPFVLSSPYRKCRRTVPTSCRQSRPIGEDWKLEGPYAVGRGLEPSHPRAGRGNCQLWLCVTMRHMRARSDESYVIDLCDRVLRLKGKRQYRFDFLRGDPEKGGSCVRLPVDAYYEKLNLVIEYRETRQSKENIFFDKPSKLTISGCHRGEQRRRYDQGRRDVLRLKRGRIVSLSDFGCLRGSLWFCVALAFLP